MERTKGWRLPAGLGAVGGFGIALFVIGNPLAAAYFIPFGALVAIVLEWSQRKIERK